MPNWVEGNLRIRGTMKQLAEFVKNAVDDEDVTKYVETDTSIDIYLKNGATYLRGSQRTFIMGEIFAEAKSPAEKKEQEYKSLRNIDESFKKAIIVKNGGKHYYTNEGFLRINLLDFLLNPDSLDW